jgi:hypothetical protein
VSRPGNTYHAVEGYIRRETEKALQIEMVQIDGAEVEQKSEWFPISQLNSITRQGKGSQELDKIEASAWILQAKGLA